MNMATWRHLVLYLTASPWDVIIAWPACLVVWALWGERLRWENRRNHILDAPDGRSAPGGPVLACDIREGSWPVAPGTWPKGFYLIKTGHQQESHPRTWGGTTFGHSIIIGPGRSSPGEWTALEEHEIGVHVEQYEAAMLRGLLIGAVALAVGQSSASLWLALGIWFTGYLQLGVANWTTAWLRGEDPYRGSAHEEAAYAIDELYEQQQQREKK